MLPAVASINGMQVKEYIQALVDDGKLRVEKIGSGNWYWCFDSEERREKGWIKEQLVREMTKIQRTTRNLETELNRVREEISATQGSDAEKEKEKEETERKALVSTKEALVAEMQMLRDEEEALLAEGIGGVEKKRKEIQTWKENTSVWTDNIYILEQYLNRLAGGDRAVVDAVLRECYGGEYVEGEGLRELPP
jgi:hypothetical protein